jgi:phosphoglycerol transferase MdoB-like AlkP superfamily enzyme
MLAAIVLAPRKGEGKRPQTMGVGLLCCLVGLGILGLVHQIWLTPNKTLAWDNYSNPAAVYDSFTDSTSALLMLGLYQYTFRDVSLSLGNQAEMGEEEAQKLEEFCETRRASKTNNEMTGVFEGKNLIMIQLEAIDTWMLSSEYMPNLWKIKQESMVFANHYTPAYITAGTLNTEIMANTGLIPATGNVSTKVYMRNQYPYSIANQMRKAGYTAESFHGSEGNVYNRGIIHPALGYEQYHSGSDMKMENYTMDHDMMSAYSDIIRDAPFYSFIITYSGHGPYSAQNPIYLAHAEEARAVAKRDEGNYVNAVAHAMETDAFIKAFIARMEEDGSLDDTALVFYADHYNYYMMNDQLNMDIKGVDDLNLLQHTDFFIYSKDMEARTISKVTSSLDILPTLANLFGLEDEDAVYIGNDAFSDAGGYVFFTDGSWYDGETYWTHDGAMTEKARIRSKEISTSFLMSNMIFKSDYFAREHD